jgi:hypothetical protein
MYNSAHWNVAHAFKKCTVFRDLMQCSPGVKSSTWHHISDHSTLHTVVGTWNLT